MIGLVSSPRKQHWVWLMSRLLTGGHVTLRESSPTTDLDGKWNRPPSERMANWYWPKTGAARETYRYDERGNVVELAVFGTDGQPAVAACASSPPSRTPSLCRPSSPTSPSPARPSPHAPRPPPPPPRPIPPPPPSLPPA